MSQFRPLPYKGDHNMVLDLRTVVFNDDNTRIHNWLINHDPNSGTATDKIIYLGNWWPERKRSYDICPISARKQ